MKRLLETCVFVSLALVGHVLIFIQPATGGAQSSGQGGEALVSLEAATAQTQQMVEDWDQSPDLVETPPDIVPPPLPDVADLPQIPALEASAAPMVLPTMMAPPPPMEQPVLDTQSAEPPPTAAPRESQRPETRPERPQAANNGQAAQRAAGAGGGAQSGLSGSATGSTLAPAQAAELQAIWGANVRARIERRKRFPSGARGSGQVVVALTVSKSGQLLGHQVQQSSGNATFDQAALQAVANASPFSQAPAELTQNSYQFLLRISFSR